MSQELVLDPRYEILDLIDKESHKYQHVNPYVQFNDEGCVVGCCVNGLVMLGMGWSPSPESWKGQIWTSNHADWGDVPAGRLTWNECARKMRDRYGERIVEDINRVNANVVNGWTEVRTELAKFWFDS